MGQVSGAFHCSEEENVLEETKPGDTRPSIHLVFLVEYAGSLRILPLRVQNASITRPEYRKP